VHYSDVITQNIRTEYAKLVDENNYRLFRFLSVRDFEPKILIKGVHLTNFEENKYYEERYTYCSCKK